jgi:hypothetical protein
MKRTWCILVLALGTGSGCLPLWVVPAKPVELSSPKAAPLVAVTAEEVNEGNAHEMAQRLRQELDRDDSQKRQDPDLTRKPGS